MSVKLEHKTKLLFISSSLESSCFAFEVFLAVSLCLLQTFSYYLIGPGQRTKRKCLPH